MNVLSSEVAADCDNVATDTQRVQRKRKETETEIETAERRTFRVQVGASLTSIAISTKEDLLRREEDKLERHQLEYMDTDPGSSRRSFYAGLIKRQRRKVAQLDHEIERMTRAARGEEINSSEEENNGESTTMKNKGIKECSRQLLVKEKKTMVTQQAKTPTDK